MERRAESYLTERIYNEGKSVEGTVLKEQEEQLRYYERLIGKDGVEYLLKHSRNFKGHLCGSEYQSSGNRHDGLKNWLRQNESTDILNCAVEKKGYFEEFYTGILQYAYERLKEKIQCFGTYYSKRIFDDFSLHLYQQLQAVCTRTLIAEMGCLKDEGVLKGDTVKEEYDFFASTMLGTWEFQETVFEKYPVLYRCIAEKVERLSDYYKEIIVHFAEEKEQIEMQLCNGEEIRRIVNIGGNFSDAHNNGRQVVRITLDNQQEILYKPRSMENEGCYMDLLHWLEEKTGIRQMYYSFLSGKEHSWCRVVKYCECSTRMQMQEYYIRLGVQLFLTYFLGTKDLHCENMIASGEYPVLVDLETMVHFVSHKKRVNVNEEIRYRLSGSVLYTGILPMYAWGKQGNGVDASGVSGGAGYRYPFKVPVIAGAGTSEMHIDYKHPEAVEEKNRAALKGELVSPAEFEAEILRGFQCAYRAVMEEREEFRGKIIGLAGTRSRFLIEHTQRYGMALMSSCHPSLLRDGAEREIYLNLFRAGRNEDGMTIADEEIQSLLYGDIPYFSYSLNDTELIGGSGRKIQNYFEQPAMEILYQRVESLCEMELQIQSDYIRCSLSALPGGREKYVNHVYAVGAEDMKRADAFRIKMRTEEIIEKILYQAVWNADRTEVSWIVPRMCGEDHHWEMQPMDLYFYDGLAGMLVLFNKIKDMGERVADRGREVYQTLKKMLFAYTDSCCSSQNNFYSRMTGAYEGEGSVVHAYMKLYDASGEEVYLEYAEKHAELVYRMLKEDTAYDVLSGNAGTAYVFILLYEVTVNAKYLLWAEEAIQVLRENMKQTEWGVGWTTAENTAPMAGMAHGNAGILIPVIAVWYYTHKEEYGELAEQIWQYENSLYNPRTGNWEDVRMPQEHQEEVGAMAWCHGAAGILESSMFCYWRVTDDRWKQRLREDVERACAVLEKYWKRDSLSLCHGVCGNLWILDRGRRFLAEVCGEVIPKITYRDILIQCEGNGLPQENVNPGLMNGYGGVIYRFI